MKRWYARLENAPREVEVTEYHSDGIPISIDCALLRSEPDKCYYEKSNLYATEHEAIEARRKLIKAEIDRLEGELDRGNERLAEIEKENQ